MSKFSLIFFRLLFFPLFFLHFSCSSHDFDFFVDSFSATLTVCSREKKWTKFKILHMFAFSYKFYRLWWFFSSLLSAIILWCFSLAFFLIAWDRYIQLYNIKKKHKTCIGIFWMQCANNARCVCESEWSKCQADFLNKLILNANKWDYMRWLFSLFFFVGWAMIEKSYFQSERKKSTTNEKRFIEWEKKKIGLQNVINSFNPNICNGIIAKRSFECIGQNK